MVALRRRTPTHGFDALRQGLAGHARSDAPTAKVVRVAGRGPTPQNEAVAGFPEHRSPQHQIAPAHTAETQPPQHNLRREKSQAAHAMRVMLKLKVAKLDPVGGTIRVKHGMYLEPHAVENAVNYIL